MTGPTLTAEAPSRKPGRALLAVLILICSATIAYTALQLHDPALLGLEPLATDLTTFHIVGMMAWGGDLPDAYSAEQLFRHQREVNEGANAMPWSYPPPFGLAAAALAAMPLPLAYLAFVAGSLAAYLLVLRRLAGEGFPMLVLMMMPVLMVNIRSGQNGFLTGALVGLLALLCLRGSPRAGLPLGLMAMKPHLGIALALLLLLTRRWRWLGQAVAVAAAAALASTLAFGPAVWPAFLGGAEAAAGFLEAGAYRFYRMTSAYAAARSFGLASDPAFALQAAVALGALAAVAMAVAERWALRRLLALAAMATPMVSPYSYDYDLTIFGVGLALAFGEIMGSLSERGRLGWFVALWVLGGYGAVATVLHADRPGAAIYGLGGIPYSLTGPLHGVLFAATFRALRRASGRAGRDATPGPGGAPADLAGRGPPGSKGRRGSGAGLAR